jgi:hypothetical protein
MMMATMMMTVEQSVECKLAGEIELLGENLPSSTLSTTNPTRPDPVSNTAATLGSRRLTTLTMARPSSEVTSDLVSQRKFQLPWNTKAYCLFHKGLPLFRMLSKMNHSYSLKSNLLQTHFNVILSSIPRFLSSRFLVIQFNSILYYLCAEPTATRPITGTAKHREINKRIYKSRDMLPSEDGNTVNS